MKSIFCVALTALAVLDAGAVLAQSATAPQQAQVCRVCHGVDGVGTNPMIPNIGGQSEEYLSKQLQDFRAGRREDPQMTIIARDLSDEDIRTLAHWFASIRATYELPD